MDRTKKIIIAIIIVVLIILVAIIAGALFISQNKELSDGNKNILVCAIDESERRPGMGACDMAFIVTLNNGTLKDYKAVYPGGLTHPTAKEPAEAQSQGAGSALLLHDAFWDADNAADMKLAKEIVEYNNIDEANYEPRTIKIPIKNVSISKLEVPKYMKDMFYDDSWPELITLIQDKNLNFILILLFGLIFLTSLILL